MGIMLEKTLSNHSAKVSLSRRTRKPKPGAECFCHTRPSLLCERTRLPVYISRPCLVRGLSPRFAGSTLCGGGWDYCQTARVSLLMVEQNGVCCLCRLKAAKSITKIIYFTVKVYSNLKVSAYMIEQSHYLSLPFFRKGNIWTFST